MGQSVGLSFGWPTVGSVVRSACQLVGQSVYLTVNRFLNQSVGLPFRSVETDWPYETICRSVGRSVDCSVGRSTDRVLRPSVDRSIGQSVTSRSANRSVERPVSRLVDRSIGRSADYE